MTVNWSLAHQPRDMVGDAYNAFLQGRTLAANKAAASAMAGGDNTGAMNAFASVGNAEQVAALQARENALQQQARQNSRQDVQDAYTAQDRTYAAQDRGYEAQARNVADKTRLRTQGLQDQQLARDAAIRLANGLRFVPPGQRKAAFDAHDGARVLQQAGFPPEAVAGLDEGHLDDQSLTAFAVQMGGEAPKQQMVQMGNGGVGSFDPSAPAGSNLQILREPDDQVIEVNPGNDLYSVPRGGVGGGQGQAPAGNITTAMLTDSVMKAVPGAQVTSGQRTPEHNREVGGVANSYHVTGQAVDVVPPHGMSMGQFAQQLRGSMPPGVQVVQESDHVHLEPGPSQGQGGGAHLLAHGPPKLPSDASGQWALTPEEAAAINTAAGEGRVDAHGLNSRTAKITAGILLANPGVNLINNHAYANLVGNAPTQGKAALAETLPVTLQNVTNAGKALKYSDVRAVGGFQQFLKTQTNDPDLQFYMTQRNDALQSIANVMRGTGMSDKAIELEREAASPTMSPRALDAWLKAQTDALKPRLDYYRNLEITNPSTHERINAPGGAGTTPPGGAQTPTTAPARPAGTKAPPSQADVDRILHGGRQ